MTDSLFISLFVCPVVIAIVIAIVIPPGESRGIAMLSPPGELSRAAGPAAGALRLSSIQIKCTSAGRTTRIPLGTSAETRSVPTFSPRAPGDAQCHSDAPRRDTQGHTAVMGARYRSGFRFAVLPPPRLTATPVWRRDLAQALLSPPGRRSSCVASTGGRAGIIRFLAPLGRAAEELWSRGADEERRGRRQKAASDSPWASSPGSPLRREPRRVT